MIDIFLKRNTKIITTIELEHGMTSTYIYYVIINKFDYEQESCPIVLLSINKNMKISFHHAILSLSLIIHLQIIGSGEFLLNVKEIV